MTKFVLVTVVSIILQLISGILTRSENNLSEEQINIFKAIASNWKGVINFEKNPCEEFYEFVCSNKEDPSSGRQPAKNSLRNIFNTKPELMTESEKKYFQYSTTCENIQSEEKEEFIKWFKFDSIGSWPAFEENWDERKFNLPLAIAEMSSYDYPVVFTQNMIFDSDGAFKTYLRITKEDLVDIYQTEIFGTIFKKLGIKNPEEVLTDAALFEKTYNDAAESVKSATDIKVKFSELKDHFPEVDWEKQMEIIYGERYVNHDYPVMIKSHEELKEIYRAISELSPKVIANYFFCVFVYNLNDIRYTRSFVFFMPIIKQAFMKHVYDQNTKEILKGMYITILNVLQDEKILHNFEDHFSSELIADFINADIFGLRNEEELAEEFNDVSANNNECIKNYHRLVKIYKKRSANPFFNSRNALVTLIRREIISDLIYQIPMFIGGPSAFTFPPAFFSILPNVMRHSRNMTIFTNAARECFTNQLNHMITNDGMKSILSAQLILKAFAEWIKNYPEVVQEENKIFEEYNLSAEKLLIISIEKYPCEIMHAFNTVMIGFANSAEFTGIYNCPSGSKMNPTEKCSFR